jgi:hypothetical protein
MAGVMSRRTLGLRVGQTARTRARYAWVSRFSSSGCQLLIEDSAFGSAWSWAAQLWGAPSGQQGGLSLSEACKPAGQSHAKLFHNFA